MGNTALGITFMLFSTSIMNLGMVLQKKAVDSMPPMEHETIKNNMNNVLRNKLWIFGWLCFVVATVLNMFALSQADMSIIQPLIGFGLVVLVVLSHFYLHENISKLEIIGIIIAIIGTIIIGISAPKSVELDSLELIWTKYTQSITILLLIIFYILIISLWIFSKKMKKSTAGIVFGILSGFFSVLGLTFSKGLFAILVISGFIPTFYIWQAYILLVIFLSNSTMAVVAQQLSFQKGKSVVVTPVYNLTSIILPLFTGSIIFGEIIGIEKIIAMVVIIIGAIFLSIKKENDDLIENLGENKNLN